MVDCPRCSETMADNAIVCEECGYRLHPVLSVPAEEGDRSIISSEASTRRPDGTITLIIAWVIFALTAICVFVGLRYESNDPTDWIGQVTLLLIGGSLFQLFLVLWGVGSIVNAISFLPGKDDKLHATRTE
jgi:hypothetical protein